MISVVGIQKSVMGPNNTLEATIKIGDESGQVILSESPELERHFGLGNQRVAILAEPAEETLDLLTSHNLADRNCTPDQEQWLAASFAGLEDLENIFNEYLESHKEDFIINNNQNRAKEPIIFVEGL